LRSQGPALTGFTVNDDEAKARAKTMARAANMRVNIILLHEIVKIKLQNYEFRQLRLVFRQLQLKI
jgi:hypothetical protein